MKVSVLILTRNNEKHLAQAIESALEQEVNFDCEIVIGDDCSTDNTRKIIQEYLSKYHNVIRPFLREDEIGINQNLLQTLNDCKGEYIAILEGDDYWTSFEKLQKQVDFLDSNKYCAVCFHNVEINYDDSNKLSHTFYQKVPEKGNSRYKPLPLSDIEALLKDNFIQTSSIMFRKKMNENFPDWYFQNKFPFWSLNILNAQNGSIGYIDEILSVCRIQPNVNSSELLSDKIKFLSSINLHFNLKYNYIIKPQIEKHTFNLIQKLINESVDLICSNMYEDALQKLSEATTLSDTSGYFTPGLYYTQAVCLMQTDSNASALNALEKELEINPGHNKSLELKTHILNLINPEIKNEPIQTDVSQLNEITYETEQDSYEMNLFDSVVPYSQNEEITFSIIIPVFNNIKYTLQCLEGIQQTASDNTFEIIIIDNASNDDTASILADLDYKINLIKNQVNENYAKANNQGAAIAKGKYLVFLNNDTNPFPGWLDAIKTEFENHSDTAIQGAKLLYENGSIQHAGMIFGARPNHPEEPYHAYLNSDSSMPFVNKRRQVQFVTGACLAIRKNIFEEVGGFDEDYIFGYEDSDICMKVNSAGLKVIYNPEIVLTHYESNTKKIRQVLGDDLMDIDSPREQKNRELFFKKWGHLVKCDDKDFYAEDGYRIEGNYLILNVPEESDIENLILIEEDQPNDIKNINEDQKRILFTMFGWHESGGGTMFPRTVAEQLSAEGYIISVFYAAGNHAVNHTPYFLEKTLENGVSLYGVYNRPSLFLDTNEPEREICDNIILDLFSEVLDSEQPDLVHFHNFLGLSFAIAELVKLRRIPSLYTPHNYHLIDPKLYLFNSDLSIWESTDFFAESELAFQNEELDISYNKRINSAQNLINNLIDYTFAVSTRQAELLIEFSGQHNNITVVHQASKITDTFQKPATSAQVQIHSPVQIGYIGAVLPHKGLHNLVLASQNLNSEDV
ncbi:MAG: glycosyltransferase, partial [Bacteroidota bacterium]